MIVSDVNKFRRIWDKLFIRIYEWGVHPCSYGTTTELSTLKEITNYNYTIVSDIFTGINDQHIVEIMPMDSR